MRAKHCVFHVDCFRCTYCDHRLVPGEEFALKDDQLFCKNDCEQHSRDAKITSFDQSADAAAFGRRRAELTTTEEDVRNIAGPAGLTPLEPALSLGSLAMAQQRLATTPPMSTTSPNSDEGVAVLGPAASTASSSSSSSSKKNKKDKAKTTRMRTVLTEKQLATLRACYAANSRPDALMKEQLVEMTSLTARVIRVWFQNKRCKDKKRQIALKQMQAAQEKVGARLLHVSSRLRSSCFCCCVSRAAYCRSAASRWCRHECAPSCAIYGTNERRMSDVESSNFRVARP